MNYYEVAKLIIRGDHVMLNREDRSLGINNIINQKYQISSHISNERAFLSLVSLPIRKHLPNNIYQQIDIL